LRDEVDVGRSLECQLCYRELEPVQAFRFLVETETLATPAYLEQIRYLPSVHGRPLCVCKKCQARLEARPRVARRVAARVPADRRQFRSAVMTALGFLTIGWVFGAVLGE
jgi:hypothetical protein